MTAYGIPASHLPTHTRKQRKPRQTAPVVAETVIYLERTPELYAQRRRDLLAVYGGELEPSSQYFSETAPAEWLALPPMKCTVAA